MLLMLSWLGHVIVASVALCESLILKCSCPPPSSGVGAPHSSHNTAECWTLDRRDISSLPLYTPSEIIPSHTYTYTRTHTCTLCVHV